MRTHYGRTIKEPEHNQEDLGGRGDGSSCWNAWEEGNSIELRVG